MFNCLSEIQNFKTNKLRKVQTKVVTADGRELIETRDRSGAIISKELGKNRQIYVGDTTPDLQVAEILPGVCLGSQDAAQDLPTLHQNKITHILNLATGTQNAFADKFVCKSVNILDLPETNICSYFNECFQFINEARSTGGKVLVHCNAGVSRSASIVIGYLMTFEGMRWPQALETVKAKRSIKPNDGFLRQLQEYDSQLQQKAQSRPAPAPAPVNVPQQQKPPTVHQTTIHVSLNQPARPGGHSPQQQQRQIEEESSEEEEETEEEESEEEPPPPPRPPLQPVIRRK